MTNPIYETRGDFGHVVSEANKTRSREQVTITLDAAEYAAGTVLMAAGAKYVRFDGIGTAAAVLCQSVDATLADVEATAHVRDAELNAAELVWSSDGTDTLTEGQVTAGTASLNALGILTR